jgi:hypothetical protein
MFTDSRKMVSKISIALTIVLMILISLSLYFETSLFFVQASVQPIKVYSVTSYGILIGSIAEGIYGSGWYYPNWTVTTFKLTIDNAFSNSQIHFRLDYANVSGRTEFFHPTGNNRFILNITEEAEYTKNNPPDMLITCPIIQNGTYYFWRDIIELPDGTYAKSVECASFLKRTSFDTWEGELLLDGKIGGTLTMDDNRTFAGITTPKATIELSIPNKYQIQNIEGISGTQDSEAFSITKTISSGETFHINVRVL